MKMYKRLFTVEDFKENFGYNLITRAKQGDFPTVEASCEAWCDEAALSIHMLIIKNRGVAFAKKLYESNNEELLDVLKTAQLYEMLFIYENGNVQLSAKIEDNTKTHSQEAIDLLYSTGILVMGM